MKWDGMGWDEWCERSFRMWMPCVFSDWNYNGDITTISCARSFFLDLDKIEPSDGKTNTAHCSRAVVFFSVFNLVPNIFSLSKTWRRCRRKKVSTVRIRERSKTGHIWTILYTGISVDNLSRSLRPDLGLSDRVLSDRVLERDRGLSVRCGGVPLFRCRTRDEGDDAFLRWKFHFYFHFPQAPRSENFPLATCWHSTVSSRRRGSVVCTADPCDESQQWSLCVGKHAAMFDILAFPVFITRNSQFTPPDWTRLDSTVELNRVGRCELAISRYAMCWICRSSCMCVSALILSIDATQPQNRKPLDGCWVGFDRPADFSF